MADTCDKRAQGAMDELLRLREWKERAEVVLKRINRDAFEPDKWRGDILDLLKEAADA